MSGSAYHSNLLRFIVKVASQNDPEVNTHFQLAFVSALATCDSFDEQGGTMRLMWHRHPEALKVFYIFLLHVFKHEENEDGFSGKFQVGNMSFLWEYNSKTDNNFYVYEV